MSVALLFAGADALEKRDQRLKALELKSVKERLKQLEDLLRIEFGVSYTLDSDMNLSDEEFNKDLARSAVTTLGVQVGLFETYTQKHGMPDFVIGCSLGDMARSVVSGAISFEEMARGVFKFCEAGNLITDGGILAARSNVPLTEEAKNQIEKFDVKVSVQQTNHHFLVSGADLNLQKWMASGDFRNNYKARLLYNKPLHSIYMRPALSAVEKNLFTAPIIKWSIPMLSTVSGIEIQSASQLRNDLIQNMVDSIPWRSSMIQLVESFKISKVVNMGPNETLLKFIERIPELNGLEIAYDF